MKKVILAIALVAVALPSSACAQVGKIDERIRQGLADRGLDGLANGATDGQALTWSAAQGKWVPGDAGGGEIDADDITTGVLAVARGGTGQGTASAAVQVLLDTISTTQGAVLYYNGTDWAALGAGTDGQVLTSNGAGANPAWEDASGGSGQWSRTSSTVYPTTTTDRVVAGADNASAITNTSFTAVAGSGNRAIVSVLGGTTTSDVAFAALRSGESWWGVEISPLKIRLGPGGSTEPDVTLERSGSSELKVSSKVTVGGSSVANTTVTATSASGNRSFVSVNGGSSANDIVIAGLVSAESECRTLLGIGRLDLGGGSAAPDVGVRRDAAGVLALSNGSTGYGRLALAASTTVSAGSGSPESSVTASPGSLYLRTDDGTLWGKESGTGNTGWAAVGGGGGSGQWSRSTSPDLITQATAGDRVQIETASLVFNGPTSDPDFGDSSVVGPDNAALKLLARSGNNLSLATQQGGGVGGSVDFIVSGGDGGGGAPGYFSVTVGASSNGCPPGEILFVVQEASRILLDPGSTTTGLVEVKGIPKLSGTNTTGAGSAALGSNSPATTNSAPYTWIQVTTSDGSTAYIPAWK